MNLSTHSTADVVEFHAGDTRVGVYVLRDRFKPHFRSLRTPAGHETVVVSPGDHRHHKGLMYALRCPDVNFWEEDPGAGACGVQEVVSTDAVAGGIRQRLVWREEGGGLRTYEEERTITGRLEGRAVRWVWCTRRRALRDHQLVKSPWSRTLADGRRINYHGLGIRLPWMWRFPGEWCGAVEVDGVATPPDHAIGCTARSVGFWGLIDGCWERTAASVTMRQEHGFAWYVLKGDFPFLAAGPSNAEEPAIPAGHETEETYEVLVADR